MNPYDFASLFKAVCESPRDWAAKRVAADWLEEYGRGADDERLAVGLRWAAKNKRHPRRVAAGCVFTYGLWDGEELLIAWGSQREGARKPAPHTIPRPFYSSLRGTHDSMGAKHFYGDEASAFTDLGRVVLYFQALAGVT